MSGTEPRKEMRRISAKKLEAIQLAGIPRPYASLTRRSPLRASVKEWNRKHRIRRVSDKQLARIEALARIKARLIEQRADGCEAPRLYRDFLLREHMRPRDERDENLIDRVHDLDAACSRRAVDLHHKRNRSQGGKDTDDSLLLLCRECHSFATDNPTDATLIGLSMMAKEARRAS